MLMRRYGRLPVLFWTQLLALGFLVGTTFAPNLPTFAGTRRLVVCRDTLTNPRISDALPHSVLRVCRPCLCAELHTERVSRTCPQVTVRFAMHSCLAVHILTLNRLGTVCGHGYLSVSSSGTETQRVDVGIHHVCPLSCSCVDFWRADLWCSSPFISPFAFGFLVAREK